MLISVVAQLPGVSVLYGRRFFSQTQQTVCLSDVGRVFVDVLGRCQSERLVPVVVIEVHLLAVGGRDGLELVVVHHVILSCDLAGVKTQNSGNGMAVLEAVADIDTSSRTSLPTGNLVPTGDGGVKYVDRTPPDVEVVELGARECLAAEQLERTATGIGSRNPIQDVDGMKDGEWPELNVSDIRPVNGGVMQHGTCNGENCSNSSFRDPIGVMGANAGVSDGLAELLQVVSELRTCVRGTVVTEILLRNDSMLGTELLEALLAIQRLVCILSGLQVHKHEARGMINKDASTLVLEVGALFAVACQQPTERVAHDIARPNPEP